MKNKDLLQPTKSFDYSFNFLWGKERRIFYINVEEIVTEENIQQYLEALKERIKIFYI